MLYVGADKAYLIDRKFCCRSVDHGVYALALGTAGANVCLMNGGELARRWLTNDSRPLFLYAAFAPPPPPPPPPTGDERGSLLDGEMITGGDGSTIYLIYDIVQFCGNYVGGRALPQRLEAVHAAVDAYFRALGAVGDDSTPFALKCKTFLPKHLVHQHLAHIAKLADGSYQYEDAAENLRNQNDGLIFTPEDEPYLPSSNQLLLKWKWPDLNSIDFKVTHPYFDRNTNNLQLQCGYNGSDITIRSIALDEGTRSWLEHHLPRHPGGVGIVECVYDANLSCWLVKKFRPDKNSGNYISTVMSTLETVIDNVTPQEICTACGSSETYAPAAAAAPVAAAASSLPAAPLSSHAPMARALVSNHAAPPPPPPQSLPVALRASMPSSASFSFAPQPPSP